MAAIRQILQRKKAAQNICRITQDDGDDIHREIQII